MNDNYKPIIAFSEQNGWIKEVYNAYLHRTKYTKNEIRVYENGICEIDVYDSFGNYKDTASFSEVDLEKILPHKWYKDATGYLSTTINKNKVRMHKLLFPNGLIDHYDNNKLNNTRENLQQTTHSINIIKITNKMKNKNGVTGIFYTKSNTWSAYIEFNGKKYNKNFKSKEVAIIQRYIWEVNLLGRNAPQLKKIKEQYPRLLVALNNQIKINSDANMVFAILNKLKDSPYCPCKLVKNSDTKCMCKEFRDMEEGECHCGLYVKFK